MSGQDAKHVQIQHGGRVYDYARASGRALEDVLDMSANINPLGPPASVMSAIRASLDEIRHYPDSAARVIKQVLSSKFGVPTGQLFCGNGASEVIDLLFRAIRPNRTFLFEPAFSEYRKAAGRSGSTVVSIQLDMDTGVSLPLEEVDGQVRCGDAVVINNPHNPTGRAWAREDWLKYVRGWSRRGAFVLVDESFIDFMPDAAKYTAIAEAVTLEHVMVIRSATKMYAIPGLRFGFAVGPAHLVEQIERQRDGWSVNHLAQVAATAAYRDAAFERETWAWLRDAQKQVFTWWEAQTNIDVFPPSVNFVLVRFRDMATAERVQSRLRECGIYVRNCANFAGLDGRYVRIAIRTAEENDRLHRAVGALLSPKHEGGA